MNKYTIVTYYSTYNNTDCINSLSIEGIKEQQCVKFAPSPSNYRIGHLNHLISRAWIYRTFTLNYCTIIIALQTSNSQRSQNYSSIINLRCNLIIITLKNLHCFLLPLWYRNLFFISYALKKTKLDITFNLQNVLSVHFGTMLCLHAWNNQRKTRKSSNASASKHSDCTSLFSESLRYYLLSLLSLFLSPLAL